jgi:hypothetical protein
MHRTSFILGALSKSYSMKRMVSSPYCKIETAPSKATAGVDVHIPFLAEQELHRPPAKAPAYFPQGHLGWLPADEKVGELVRKLLLAERVVVDEDDELQVPVVYALRLLFLWLW